MSDKLVKAIQTLDQISNDLKSIHRPIEWEDGNTVRSRSGFLWLRMENGVVHLGAVQDGEVYYQPDQTRIAMAVWLKIVNLSTVVGYQTIIKPRVNHVA